MPQAEPFFPNFEETGYEEISDWTPSYYQDILETDTLMKFAGQTVDTMALQLERWCQNMYIDTMDEEMLSRMEAFYYMGDNSDRPIDERRRLLKSMQMGSGKISRDRISRIVKAYTGLEPKVEFYHKLIIRAYFDDAYTLTPSDLPKILAAQIPGHIKMIIEFVISVIFQLEEYVEIPHIGFHVPIKMFDELTLDGTWLLDGSHVLDTGSTYDVPVGIITPYGVENELDPPDFANVNFRSGIETDEEVDANLAGMIIPFETISDTKNKFATGYPIETDEDVGDCSVLTISEDDWYLDNTYFLDGSKDLIIYEKEDL